MHHVRAFLTTNQRTGRMKFNDLQARSTSNASASLHPDNRATMNEMLSPG